MGELEKESRRRDMRRLILQTVGTAGVLSVGLVAPNVIGAAARLGFIPNSRDNEIIKRSTTRLKNGGLLVYKAGKYRLTKEGEKFLRKWELAGYLLNQSRKWDSKWRIIIFDIPEKLRKIRWQIRDILSSAGFTRIQDSVWVFPYDCEDIITLIKTDLGVSRHVLYIIAEQLENDRHLRQKFNLV